MGVLATQGIYRPDRAWHVLRRTAEHETLQPQGQGDDRVMTSRQRAERPIGMIAAIAVMDSVTTAKKQLV
jgi:hypothetical protein